MILPICQNTENLDVFLLLLVTLFPLGGSLTFWMNMSPPSKSQRSKSGAGFLLGLFFDTHDGGNMFI
jgi:hypothetical protein